MDDRADHGGAIAIIGLACRFPGAAEPAEFHDLIVAGRRMFRPLSGGPPPLHAAPLDDWSASPGSYEDHGAGAQDTGPVQKLAAETTALALADAGLRDLAGMLPEAAARLHGVSGPLPAAAGRRGRTGLIIASAAAGVCEQVREQFAVGAITDLTPFMSPPPPAARLAGVAGAGRPLPVPRMRDGEPSDAAPDARHETGPRTTIRSGQSAG